MKWENYTSKATEKTTKLLCTRGGYYLMLILGLALVMGAGVKWVPGR
ncbi:hypothetical protein LM595_03020 [Candidatus Acetothermia bacterium]|jgi:hypothetical protein|nr:hypothetical protein [Candidatus Acetothermia bacterium]